MSSTPMQAERLTVPIPTAGVLKTPPRTRTLRRGELLRKLIHVAPGSVPFLSFWVPQTDPLSTFSLLKMVAIAVVLTAVFLACWRIVRRPNEVGLLSATLSYPFVILGVLFLFPGDSELACVVVTVLAFGDTAAHVCGRLWAQAPLPWNRRKTWIGTFAFVVCSAPFAVAAYWLQGHPTPTTHQALACGISGAVAGALAESLPMKVTDNLRIGVVTAIVAATVHFAMR